MLVCSLGNRLVLYAKQVDTNTYVGKNETVALSISVGIVA